MSDANTFLEPGEGSEKADLEAGIETVLTRLVENFQTTAMSTHQDEFDALFNGEKSTVKDFAAKQRPYIQQWNAFADLMVSQTYPDVPREKQFNLTFLYTHYGFVRRFVASQIAAREGLAGSVDKTVSVMNFFVQHVANPEFKFPVEQEWVYPKVSALPLWVDLVYALPFLDAGQLGKVMEVNNRLSVEYASEG